MGKKKDNKLRRFVIYMITNLITKKIYIGKTTLPVPEDRFEKHCANRKRSGIAGSIQKHGRENFTFEIMDEFTNISDLNRAEEYYVCFYDCMAPKGYNLKGGGGGGLHSEETKIKMSNSKKGIKHTVEQNEKFSKSMKEVWGREGFREFRAESLKEVMDTQEYKDNLSNSIKEVWEREGYKESHAKSMDLLRETTEYKENLSKGIKESWTDNEYKERMSLMRKEMWSNPEFKQKMSEIRINVVFSEEAKKNMSKGQLEGLAKPFNAYLINSDSSLTYVGTWENKVTCGNDLGLNGRSIGQILNNKSDHKTHRGYTFQYTDEEVKIIEMKKTLPKQKSVTCVTNGKTYENIQQASKDLNISVGQIHKAVRQNKSTRGHFFKKN